MTEELPGNYTCFIDITGSCNDFSNFSDDCEYANKLLNECDDANIIKEKLRDNMKLKIIDIDSEFQKCKNLEACNVAPKGKFRVIGVDMYSNRKWIQGDFNLLVYAKKVADKMENDVTMMSIYNDEGKSIEEISVGEIDIEFRRIKEVE